MISDSYVSLGDFEEGQTKSYGTTSNLVHRFYLPQPVPELSEGTLETLTENTEAAVTALRDSLSQFYLVFFAIWERDGSNDIDQKWGNIVEKVRGMVQRETSGSGDSDNLSAQIDAIKSDILTEITNSILKWNEDELLQVLAYHKWQLFPSQTFNPEDDPDGSSSNTTVTATTWTEYKDYANSSRVSDGRTGRYRVKTRWAYEN